MCDITLNPDSGMYFVNVSIILDEAFTPAVLEAIEILSVLRAQIGVNGQIILGTDTRTFHVEVDSNRTISEEVPPIMERDRLYTYQVCVTRCCVYIVN